MFMLVCLPCCLLLSGFLLSLASVSFRSCEDCSTTSVCLLLGLVLLPCGISGKMTITLDITSIFVYHVVCFFLVLLLLDSSSYVAIVRIRSTTLVRLLHGLGLLPSGISGKMTVTLDLTTIFAMLVVSMLSLCHGTYLLFLKPPNMP